MTITQLEYIIAVYTHKHFGKAAESCFVTQPTLSMQIQKLEDELEIKIFDRTKQPVMATEVGTAIIEQAIKIIAEKNLINEILQNKKGIFSGELRIGIIPTIAPYLLPLFVQKFTKKYPLVKLIVTELTTQNIITQLKENKIDAGILVTPLNEVGLTEHVLFYEELLAYVSKNNPTFKKSVLKAEDIDANNLWLLEDGHCFKSQILNLCKIKSTDVVHQNFSYEAGSFESLKRMVDVNDGITILPELAIADFSTTQMQKIKPFKNPAPVREVSIVVHRNIVKRRLIEALKQEITITIPEKIRKNKATNIIPIAE